MLVVGIVVRDQEEICAIKLCSTDWLGKSVWLTWGKLAEPSTVKKTLSQTCHQVMGRVFGLIFIIICMKRYYYGLLSKFYSSLQDFRIKWDTNNFTHTYLHNCCIWFATHVSYGIWILYFLSISVFNLLLVFFSSDLLLLKKNGGLRFVAPPRKVRERETDTPKAWSFHWWNIHQVNWFFWGTSWNIL